MSVEVIANIMIFFIYKTYATVPQIVNGRMVTYV